MKPLGSKSLPKRHSILSLEPPCSCHWASGSPSCRRPAAKGKPSPTKACQNHHKSHLEHANIRAATFRHASLSSYICVFVAIHTYTHFHITHPCPSTRAYTARCYFVYLVSGVDCKTSCRDRTAKVIGRRFRPPPSENYMSICTWRYKL